jgi:lauroyl/myristoyl acyltransferase
VVALTTALAARFEAAIGEAPEQWWAAFQPFWTDQRARGPEG